MTSPDWCDHLPEVNLLSIVIRMYPPLLFRFHQNTFRGNLAIYINKPATIVTCYE